MIKKCISYIFILIIICTSTCRKTAQQSTLESLDDISTTKFSNYSFDPSSSIISRVADTPGFVLEQYKKYDNVDYYTSYYPTENEIKIIESYIELLPPLNKKTLQERLIGIYFINKLTGSGIADFVLDENRKMYTILTINPETIKNDISKWLSYRENSCFITDDPEISIRVDCGSKYLGLMYILLHESSHIVDYIHEYTPYVEIMTRNIKKEVKSTTPFVDGTWKDYAIPVKKFDRDFRKNITFYKLGGGPKIKISEWQTVYDHFETLPFASLYAAMTWAEDFAEMVTWYHYTQKLGESYTISIYKNNKIQKSYEPAKFSGVEKRVVSIISIYK